MANLIFGGLDFCIVNIEVIYEVIYAYKIYDMDVESTQIVTNLESLESNFLIGFFISILILSLNILRETVLFA